MIFMASSPSNPLRNVSWSYNNRPGPLLSFCSKCCMKLLGPMVLTGTSSTGHEASVRAQRAPEPFPRTQAHVLNPRSCPRFRIEKAVSPHRDVDSFSAPNEMGNF
ncbi:hypothetical protein L1887_09594 [Cichorium endivia]|nr:hypothetical protein L1887_09594 [Cichorium endivia]